MSRRHAGRFAAQAVVLAAAAAVAAALDLGAAWIAAVMGGSYALVVLVELVAAHRRRPAAAVPQALAQPTPAPAEPGPAEPPRPDPPPARIDAATPERVRWNVPELRRQARARSGADPERDRAVSFLLAYLHECADPDGLLPREFDGFVRRELPDLLEAEGVSLGV